MELQPWMIEYVEAHAWDEDLKQDIYVKLLELEDKEIDTNYLSRMYSNARLDERRIEARRREIEVESVDYITSALGLVDEGCDPMDLMIAEQEVARKLKELSPILRVTLERVVIDGAEPEDVAVEEGTSVNVIYQRVHQAKTILRGENNE